MPETVPWSTDETSVDDTVPTAPLSVGLQEAMRERLVVAPCGGRFASLPPEVFSSEGEWVERGQQVAHVVTGKKRVPVTSRFQGWVMGALASEGQPVTTGSALLWIRST